MESFANRGFPGRKPRDTQGAARFSVIAARDFGCYPRFNPPVLHRAAALPGRHSLGWRRWTRLYRKEVNAAHLTSNQSLDVTAERGLAMGRKIFLMIVICGCLTAPEKRCQTKRERPRW